MDQLPTFLRKDDTRKIVEALCAKEGIDYSAFVELIQAEIDQMGKLRKKGLYDSFNDVLSRILKEDLK